MKKAEGEVVPKPVPRFGAKSPAPSSPPALRRVKPASSAASSPISSPISSPTPSWPPLSTHTSTEELKKVALKHVHEEEQHTEHTNGPTTPTSPTTPTAPTVSNETPKEIIVKPIKQNTHEESQEARRIKDLESELTRLNTTREQQLQEISRLHSELEKSKGIISSHELANEKLNQHISSMQSQIGNLENDNKRMLKEFEEFKNSTLERLRTEAISNQARNSTETKPDHVDDNNDTRNLDRPSRTTPSNTNNNNNNNNFDHASPLSTPTKQSPPSFYNQNGNNENTESLRHQNHTPPPMTSSLLYSDSPSPSKINSATNPNYTFGKHVSYSNSRKSPLPPAHQSKNTLQDLQGLLSDMIKTAQEQKSNVEILLKNIDVTLSSSSSSPLTSSSERPMTPEETVYFRGEKKNLEREHSRLEGVISELKGQKTRCDSKLERAKQKIEENEAKQLASSSSSLSHSTSSPSPYPIPASSYLEVRDLSPSHTFDSSPSSSPSSFSPSPSVSSISLNKLSISPTNKSYQSSTTSYSPTRNISPYFYYGNNNDKMELPPPPDRFSPSLHKLTSDHIQKYTPQFVPDTQKLKSFPSNSTLPHATEKLPPPAVSKDEPLRPSFEWNYYFASRS